MWATAPAARSGYRHPLRGPRVRLRDYLKHPHAVVDVLQGQQAAVDIRFTDLGLRREAGIVVGSFLAALLAIPKAQ